MASKFAGQPAAGDDERLRPGADEHGATHPSRLSLATTTRVADPTHPIRRLVRSMRAFTEHAIASLISSLQAAKRTYPGPG